MPSCSLFRVLVLLFSCIIFSNAQTLQAQELSKKSSSFFQSFQEAKEGFFKKIKKLDFGYLSWKKKSSFIANGEVPQKDPATIGLPLISLQYGRNILEPGSSFISSDRRVPFHTDAMTEQQRELLSNYIIQPIEKKLDLEPLSNLILFLCASGEEALQAKASELILEIDEKIGFMGTDLAKKTLPFLLPYTGKGGNDFVTIALVPLLYLFSEPGEKSLSQEAHDHLISHLLNVEWDFHRVESLAPGQFALSAAYLDGIVEESENHALMIYTTLYLLAKYHYEHEKNEEYSARFFLVEEKLLNYISYIKTRGFHEFNSQPYVAHAMHPLLLLDSFASDNVQQKARELLDRMSYQYALGSLNGRFFAPFCRHEKMLESASLVSNHQEEFMKVWAEQFPIKRKSSHYPKALLYSYRPSEEVLSLAREKSFSYYTQMGHGERGSSEIFWGQPGLLLSAGGSKSSLADHRVVLRPITLLLDDGAEDVSETIHLGKHNECQRTNGSGVYKNFACSAKELYLGRYSPIMQEDSEKGSWFLLNPKEDIYVIAYTLSSKEHPFSLLTVFSENDLPSKDATDYFSRVIEANPDHQIEQRFTFPETQARVHYDTHAPKELWVIKDVEEPNPLAPESFISMKRTMSQWPLIGIDLHSSPLL